MRKLAFVCTGLSAFVVGLALESCKAPCDVGSEGCECTTGGACNAGLVCLSHLCVNAGPNPDNDEQSDEVETGDSNSTTSDDGDPSDSDTGESDTGDKLDMPQGTDTDQPCTETGCK